jgi:hypothetical protein
VKPYILVSMSGWAAPIALIVSSFLVVLLGYAFVFWRFSRHMKKGSFSFPAGLRQKFAAMRTARKSAKAWFAERDHWIILLLAIVIMCWGLTLSASSGDGLDFSRSGALITLLALISAFVGSIHAEGLLRPLKILETAAGSETSRRADGLSRVWIAIIIVMGTLIWGYGDLAFPHFSKLICPTARNRLINLRCSALPLLPKITVLVQPEPEKLELFPESMTEH